MLERGAPAPDFELTGVEAGEIGEFRLADAVSESLVLLAFYPADFSPECVDELCSLRDIDLLTLRSDVQVFGISADSVYSHRAFAEEFNLSFPLLVDSLGEVAEGYGVLHETIGGHRRLPKRALFLIGTDGRIRYAWATEDPGALPDFDDVQTAVERAVRADADGTDRPVSTIDAVEGDRKSS